MGKAFPAQLRLDVGLPTGDTSALQIPNFLRNSEAIQSFPKVWSFISSPRLSLDFSLLPALTPAQVWPPGALWTQRTTAGINKPSFALCFWLDIPHGYSPGPQQLLEELELQCSLSWSNPRFQRCSMGDSGAQMLILEGLSLQSVLPVQGSREGTMGHGEPLSWGQLQPCHLFLLSQENRGFAALIDFFPLQSGCCFPQEPPSLAESQNQIVLTAKSFFFRVNLC